MGLGGGSTPDFAREMRVRVGTMRGISSCTLAREYNCVKDWPTNLIYAPSVGEQDASARDALAVAEPSTFREDTRPDEVSADDGRLVVSPALRGPIPAVGGAFVDGGMG